LQNILKGLTYLDVEVRPPYEDLGNSLDHSKKLKFTQGRNK